MAVATFEDIWLKKKVPGKVPSFEDIWKSSQVPASGLGLDKKSPESFVGPPYAAAGEIRPLPAPPPVEGIRPIADPDDITLQAAPTPTVASVKRPTQTIGAMVPFGMPPGSGFGDPLGLSEITTAIREMVAPTTPYTEKEATKAYKEIPRTLENVGLRALTLGGLAGPLMGLKPSELRAALDEDIRDSAGFGEALAPALGETTLLAVEWGYLYPKLFKAVGAAPRLIAKIPGVSKGAKALKSLGGIEKLATKYPRLYNRVSKVLGAFSKGATVGTITALPEALGEELPAGEVLKHTGKSAAIMGGIAGTFQVLSQVDTARYVKQLRNSLIKASNQRFTAKIAELKSTLAPRQANEAMKSLTNAKRLELQQIDNIVSGAEAQLIGLKSGKLYQQGQGMVESPQKAAERFIRQGLGAGKPFKGEPLLKKGLGQAKPFIEMPTTRAGEVREALAEAAKVARHPVKAARKAVAGRLPIAPKAVTPPPVVPGAPAAEVTPEKRVQAIDFIKDVLSQEQYATLDEKAKIEIGQRMLAEQGVEVTAEELAETPVTVPIAEPQPSPTGRKPAEAVEIPPKGQIAIQDAIEFYENKIATEKRKETDRFYEGEIGRLKTRLEQGEKFVSDPAVSPFDALIKKPAEAEKEIKDVEKEAITEPTPSPEVEPRQARKFIPTGKLDPTNAEEALEITRLHVQGGGTVGGIFETKWDSEFVNLEGRKGGYVVTSVEYTSKQVDTAYRTIQKPVESPMPDTELFAMPGKEAQMKAIAEKMAKVKGVVRPKKVGPKPLTKPTALPKAKTSQPDHIKAVYQAAAKETERLAINGVKVEGDTIVATDGRRMFWAKGKWGEDGIYLEAAALKKGSLGKLDKTGQKFPPWRAIVPDVSDVKPITVNLEAALSHVRQAAILTSEESTGITIIENKDELLGLGFAAAAPEVGHAEINVYSGGRILGAVNPRYLLDAIKFHAIRGDTTIEFYFTDPTRPILTKSLDGKTATLTMPINPGEPSEAIKKAVEQEFPPSRRGELKKGFTPDPSVEGEAAGKPGFAGIAGRPGGKVPKPWLTDDKVKSPNEDIENFFGRTRRAPYSRKASAILGKISTGLKESFEYAHHITKTPANAIYVDMIRTMPEVRRAERERAVRDILEVLEGDGTVSGLDSVGLDTLRRKIFIQDLIHEAEIDRSVSGDFSLEELEAENERIDALIEKVPSVKKAFEARQKLWKSVSVDLLERGVLDAESAKNQAYVRHFVLDLAEKNGPTGFKKKRLSAPFRAYSKYRKGSKRDISTDYLEVEVRALADIYADNAVEDVANKIAELADKRKMYAAMARAENFQNLVGGSENVKRILELRANLRETARDRDSDTRQQRKAWIEELIDLDPTYPFRKRIAMHMGKFKKVTEGTDFEIEEDSVLFKELARAAKEQAKEPAGLAARGVFKAMADRTRLIKLALGKDYLTAEKVALRDDYVEYFYLRPNLFYRAQTITQAQIAAFVENTAEEAGGILSIPVEKMNEALVLGRRKGWLIPSELADQLNDLPVNKRNPHLSFSKPFIQYWKRWILRYHLLRYNTRNLVGDFERFWTSGQEHAIKYIPKAVKTLILKEGKEYELMKQHGVISSSLWHEMNDVSKIREFERFKDFSKPKTFKAATKKTLMAPLTVISRIGSAAQNLTQFREDILRAATFMANYDKLKEGKNVRHWAGKIADIDAIANIDKGRAAAKISRETLGDYGKFTPFENDVLRQGLMPFYSWFKINTLFWPHVVLEAAKEGGTGTAIARSIPRVGLNVARWLVRALFVYGGMYWWNHRDEEAEDKEASLPYWQRSLPHLNIGDYTLWGQTALSDFAEWTDMSRLSGIMWRRDAGFITWKEAGLEASRVIAEAPVNKVYQALSPFMKAPITAISGLETYPSVFRPRQVAPKSSRKSLERAMLGIMGSDVKRFHQTLKGDRKFEDTLYAYFAGWIVRPMDVDTFIAEVQRSKKWTTLKVKSTTTGRRAGQAKKGREVEFQERKARIRAIQKRVITESER